MLFVLKWLKREPFWLITTLVLIFISAFLIIGQARVLTNIFSLPSGGDVLLERVIPVEEVGGRLNILIEFIKTYQKEGRESAFDYLQSFNDFVLIIFVSVIILVVVMLSQIFSYIKDVSVDFLSIRVTSKIREGIFERMIKTPSSHLKGSQSGDLLSRALNDVLLLKNEINDAFEAMIFGPLLTALGLWVFLHLNVEFTFILLGAGTLLVITITVVSFLLKAFVRKIQKNLSDITAHMQNILFAMDIIKVFNRGQYEITKFQKLIKSFVFNSTSERAIQKLNRPVSEIFGSIALVTIFTYGTFKIWNKEMAFTDIMEFVVILLFVAPYVQRVTRSIFIKQKIDVYAERLEKVLSMPQEKDDPSAKSLVGFSGRIKIEKLRFAYPDTSIPALAKIDLDIHPGQFIAIVGASGSGKSTFVNLVTRLIEPTSGSIYFDDEDYMELSLKFIRSQIAYVSQESILFPGTIRENICYGRLDANEEEIVEAAKHAHVHDFIMEKDDGYDAVIGERGLKLSGGQRQRLCIARAILKNPKILILDEATSALDTQSERAVQKAIESLVHQQTTFVIAHRLSTILNADKILVFEKGEVVETGTHQELLDKKGKYANLYQIQFQRS